MFCNDYLPLIITKHCVQSFQLKLLADLLSNLCSNAQLLIDWHQCLHRNMNCTLVSLNRGRFSTDDVLPESTPVNAAVPCSTDVAISSPSFVAAATTLCFDCVSVIARHYRKLQKKQKLTTVQAYLLLFTSYE